MKNSLSLIVVIIFSILLLNSCATKIPFEQTCLTCVKSQRLNCTSDCPETIMVDTNCIAVFDEIGEKMELNYILKKENIIPKANIPITLAKIRGRYFITGTGFKNLWILTPKENQAKVKSVLLPDDPNLSIPPVFEVINGNLLVRDAQSNASYIWDIDKKKWITNYIKAGA